jgi:hypothetical protein
MMMSGSGLDRFAELSPVRDLDLDLVKMSDLLFRRDDCFGDARLRA